jgi:L-ascorbate metabolism protein UlaG (beta-lactamase superfamily)
VGCKVVIPIHWGTFPMLLDDPAPFVSRVKEAGKVKPVVIRPGETYEV